MLDSDLLDHCAGDTLPVFHSETKVLISFEVVMHREAILIT